MTAGPRRQRRRRYTTLQVRTRVLHVRRRRRACDRMNVSGSPSQLVVWLALLKSGAEQASRLNWSPGSAQRSEAPAVNHRVSELRHFRQGDLELLWKQRQHGGGFPRETQRRRRLRHRSTTVPPSWVRRQTRADAGRGATTGCSGAIAHSRVSYRVRSLATSLAVMTPSRSRSRGHPDGST